MQWERGTTTARRGRWWRALLRGSLLEKTVKMIHLDGYPLSVKDWPDSFFFKVKLNFERGWEKPVHTNETISQLLDVIANPMMEKGKKWRFNNVEDMKYKLKLTSSRCENCTVCPCEWCFFFLGSGTVHGRNWWSYWFLWVQEMSVV